MHRVTSQKSVNAVAVLTMLARPLQLIHGRTMPSAPGVMFQQSDAMYSLVGRSWERGVNLADDFALARRVFSPVTLPEEI